MASRKTLRKTVSGSPLVGEPEYLVVGILRRPHGVQGEMLMHVITDFPERLKPEVEVFLGDRFTPAIIESSRSDRKGILIKFLGIDTPEAAGVLRNEIVYVGATDLPVLTNGRFYHHQLVGCTVIDDHDKTIGTLLEILETGANDVFVIESPGGKQLLLPVIHGVVLGVDTQRQLVRVRVPEGLEAGKTS